MKCIKFRDFSILWNVKYEDMVIFVSSELSVLILAFRRRFLELLLAGILKKEIGTKELDLKIYTTAVKFKAWKKFKPERVFCDTSAVLYQLSYQTNWELVRVMLVKRQIHTEIATCNWGSFILSQGS